MFILSPEQVESIMRRLDFLRVEVGDIANFHGMTQAEYIENRDRRRSLERLAENVVNAVVDIAKIVLSSADLPVPDTYRDVVLQLGTAGILDACLAQKLAEMVRLRNVLAHQYLDIRWAGLQSFTNEAPVTVRQFGLDMDRLLEVSRGRHSQGPEPTECESRD